MTNAMMSPCLFAEKSCQNSFLVVYEERRRPLRIERRQALPFPTRFAQANALADDRRYRQPGAELLKEGRRDHIAPLASLAASIRFRFGSLDRNRSAEAANQ
jgi:hypothetical protein